MMKHVILYLHMLVYIDKVGFKINFHLVLTAASPFQKL